MGQDRGVVDLDLYFLPDDEALTIEIGRLHPTRARPEGIEEAGRRMDEAAAGQRARRAPISVRLRDDGDYDILDGNSTYAVAKARGWSHLRARVSQ